MKKELKELLESDLLNDETKTQLSSAIEAVKTDAIEEAKKALEVEYAVKLTEGKEKIESSLTDLLKESVASEVAELKDDIEKYRNLEVEYAQKLQEFKEEYAAKLEESFTGLVTESVKAEMGELREDLVESKKQNFGQRLFEAFASEFEEFGIGEDVKSLRTRLSKLAVELEESKKTVDELNREKVMESVLSSLTGSKREVMKTILENVSTDLLEERYNETIASVLEEKKEETKEKKPLVEGDTSAEEIARLKKLIGN